MSGKAKTSTKQQLDPAGHDYPHVYTRDQHPVSRQLISDNAQKVLYRLSKAGFEAYLVGGGVRDILLGINPKDFDIVTNATPEQIKGLFRNCRLIGRRFRLAHIVFGRDIIEVATFRGHHDSEQHTEKRSKTSDEGMLLRDNIYGTIDEDAERRDFTVNALYYNIKDFCVYDFAGGVEDIQQGMLRLIGDPETRYREDPVRMLRAIRFAVKLNMTINERTSAPIYSLAELLANIPAARMFEEFNKLFMSGAAVATYKMLQQYDVFKYFFPHLAQIIRQDGAKVEDFILRAMHNTDQRIANDQRVTPAFLLAAMLWQPMQQTIAQLKQNKELTPQDRFFHALHQVMSEQQQSVAIPKRFQALMKDIWILQERFERRDAKRANKTLEHEKFRAGYDFLLLRAEIEGGNTEQLAKWWTTFSQASHHTQQQMLKASGNPKARHHSRRRKPKRKAKSTHDA